MGKLILICGENSSGKSRYAEALISKTDKKRYYIATMVCHNEENVARIEKHRRQRDGLGFETLEIPYDVKNAQVEKDSIVLLEDASNLLANAIFDKGENEEHVFADIMGLVSRCSVLAAIAITGLEPGDYDGETAGYIESINRLNDWLWNAADTVINMEDYKPVLKKGTLDGIV